MSFTAPLLLSALATLAIPVILHLMARDVPKTVHFPTLRFIMTDKLETHSKKGIRDFLILLMRCLAIAALVFAFSKPFLAEEKTAALSAEQVVVLIDNSVSMNRPEFKQSLESLLSEKLSEEDSVALIVSSNGIDLKKGFTSKDAVLQDLVDLKMTQNEGRHEESLFEAVALFNQETAIKKLFIISDFRHSDWNLSRVPSLEKSLDLELINPFSEDPPNVSLYVERIRRLSAGDIIQAQVKLSNYSNEPQVRNILFTSGQKKVEQQVELKARELKKVVLTMENPDNSMAVVEIEQDGFPWDDKFHLWVGEEAPIKVAFPEQGEQKSLEYIFVEKALQAVKSPDASFRVQAVDSQLFSPEDLNEFQVVVLSDSAHSLQPDVYEALNKFVDQGGLLICAPAQRAGMIFSRLKAHGLADIRFEEQVKRKSSLDLPFRFEESLSSEPMLSIFDQTQDSDLQQFPIYVYNKFSVSGTGKSILEITKGTPGMTVFSKGKGSVIVSAIPFNHLWSDLTLSNSFLPLLRQMIITSVGSEENSVLKLHVGAKKLQPGTDSEYLKTQQAGNYVVDEIPVEVNVSRLESVPDKLNLIDFKARLRNTSAGKVTVSDKKVDGEEYWHYFFLLAVIALLTEFVLADFKAVKKSPV